MFGIFLIIVGIAVSSSSDAGYLISAIGVALMTGLRANGKW